VKVKVKSKVVTVFNYAPHHEDILESGGKAPQIINLGI
jgi:hypothetical protein